MSFDTIINRRNTGSVKWDFMAEKLNLEGDDLLPMWVSDYDFQCPPTVIEALHKRVEHAVFGYAERDVHYYDALIHWYKTQHNLSIQRQWVATVHGVLPGLAVAIQMLTNINDNIVLQTPGYGAFRKIIELNQRQVIENPLIEEDGHYSLDLVHLEQCLQQGAQMLVLCNPHNPTGNAWTEEEITAIANLCHQYQVPLFSDEIWGDLNMPGHRCHSALSLPSILQQQLIVATASSKTFGLSSLRISNFLIPNETLKNKFVRQLDAHGMDVFNALSMCAATAAYDTGSTWLDQLKLYLKQNIALLGEFLASELPKLKFVPPQAGYLAWVDCRALQLSDEVLQQKLVQAGLVVSMGVSFGHAGSGFIRLNLGCPRATLQQALQRLKQACESD